MQERDRIVAAALAALGEKGIEGVTLRSVADRLGVRHNTVRWHIESKARLFELMSDEIIAGCTAAPLPDDWAERVFELSSRYRARLLHYRDGARLVAGVGTYEPATLDYAEVMISALRGSGATAQVAAWAHFTILYFLLGISQEEQAVDTVDPATKIDRARYPTLWESSRYLGPSEFDARFRFGLQSILARLRTDPAGGLMAAPRGGIRT
ncbi:TetR/AcrR family transcriptional regulator C-terminal domain-containing protein [Streptomyces sp. NPDC046977]|uniref:TetR/AcrR family transcriptional regulator C-terminal domain-containing protein n=1 Tax=Streptomyces sp. NPDC046977 TaxID=3154703 RepID=UPI0033F29345